MKPFPISFPYKTRKMTPNSKHYKGIKGNKVPSQIRDAQMFDMCEKNKSKTLSYSFFMELSFSCGLSDKPTFIFYHIYFCSIISMFHISFFIFQILVGYGEDQLHPLFCTCWMYVFLKIDFGFILSICWLLLVDFLFM